MEGSVQPSYAAKTFDVEQQKDIYNKLQDHFDVILNAPCNRFPGYPFAWDGGHCKVSITAIIEHFEKEQQDALIASCNRMLMRKGGHLSIGSSYIISSLKASELQRVEGGIQFEVSPSTSALKWPAERIMEELRTCQCADLWKHVLTFTDFLNLCQIRYGISSFGGTDVKEVRFTAYAGLPIFLMLWLLRQLDFDRESSKCGLGKVIIVERHGLPNDKHDHDLHYKSGIIKWD